MKIFAYLWNFLFERVHNYFDILFVIALMHYDLSWTDWQFWVGFVVWIFATNIGYQLNEKLQVAVKIRAMLKG